MSDARMQFALDGKKATNSVVALGERTDVAMIDLRGLAGDKGFMAAAKKALGLALPTEPRSSTTKGNLTVLWLSVDQWLVTCPRDEGPKVLDKLTSALSKVHALAVDVSDARSIIRLEGDNARQVLAKGTSADLFGDECGKGYVRRLRFAELAALAHIVQSGPDVIDLYVFRSYADYVWHWLEATSHPASAVRLFAVQDEISA